MAPTPRKLNTLGRSALVIVGIGAVTSSVGLTSHKIVVWVIGATVALVAILLTFAGRE
jgi:hypothetical protein